MQDLLDLCRLNLMEEHVAESPAMDSDTTLAAIDIAKRKIVTCMEPTPIDPGAMDRHRAENTAADGIYPWNESPEFSVEVGVDMRGHYERREEVEAEERAKQAYFDAREAFVEVCHNIGEHFRGTDIEERPWVIEAGELLAAVRETM